VGRLRRLEARYLISSEEALNSLSAALGVDMGMFSCDIRRSTSFRAGQRRICNAREKEIDSDGRDAIRAAVIRERLRANERRS
jgi:protein-arginine kinase